MKSTLIIFALLIFVTSCSKNSPDPVEPQTQEPVDSVSHIIALGKGSAKKNELLWTGEFYAYLDYPGHFGIGSRLEHSNSLLEKFSLTDIPCKKGIYYLERAHYLNAHNGIPEALYSVVLDLDQYLNGYNVDTTRFNQYVEVLHYDSSTQVVEGRFQAFLEGPNNYSFLPDSIALTDGKFHLKIQN